MYPRGDTFRGILELQLGAVVLKLMVFGRLKKEMGRREPYFFEAVLKFPSWVEIFWVMLVLLGILGRIFFFEAV